MSAQTKPHARRVRRDDDRRPHAGLELSASSASLRLPEPAWVEPLHRHWIAAGDAGRRMAIEHLNIAARCGNWPPRRILSEVCHALRHMCFSLEDAAEVLLQLCRYYAPTDLRVAAAQLAGQIQAFGPCPIKEVEST